MNHFEKFESYIPIDLNSFNSFLLATILIFFIIVLRYFLIAGLFYLLFYIYPSPTRKRRLIYEQLPSAESQIFEIKWSIITSAIFAVSGALIGWMWKNDYTKIYLKFNEHGWSWLIFSLFIISFIHDTYFYFMHRILHTKWLYVRFHKLHHASLTPSPWASFSFHPAESVLEALPIPIILCFVPTHPTVVIFYLSLMTLSAVTNHLGFEILPKGSARHWLGRWFISGVHHSQHHKYFTYNYALFFTFWDRLLGTQHVKYEEQFDNVVKV